MRIDKILSHSGYGTRKTVKALLKDKAVKVDNNIITKGNLHVDPKKETITVHDEVVHYQKYIYLMLHKPADFVSATTDDRDHTVIELVPTIYSHFTLFPVGRLDKDTEGLLILTNDGEVNHVLTSPKNDIFKTYYAKIDGYVKEEHIPLFKQGITLDDGYKSKPAFLRILHRDDISEVELSISEGKFHQVKRMFQAIDMEVIYLKRIQMGEIKLDPRLPIGKIRQLNEDELEYVEMLKNSKEGV